ncbi:MAG: hypothetical protein IKF97_07415 [Clostridia bacterium]|nr:hypothetical protein [Clostridia bacterium]
MDTIYNLDNKNREIKTNLESLLSEINKTSKEIGFLMQKQEQLENIKKLQNFVSSINDKITTLQNEQKEIQSQINSLIYSVPNYCDESVPIGPDESNNTYVKY